MCERERAREREGEGERERDGQAARGQMEISVSLSPFLWRRGAVKNPDDNTFSALSRQTQKKSAQWLINGAWAAEGEIISRAGEVFILVER